MFEQCLEEVEHKGRQRIDGYGKAHLKWVAQAIKIHARDCAPHSLVISAGGADPVFQLRQQLRSVIVVR